MVYERRYKLSKTYAKSRQWKKIFTIAYDYTGQLIELIESYGDTINSTRDQYIVNISLRPNGAMRILTVFSVILPPLSLIVGLYGMNGLDLTKLNDFTQDYSSPSYNGTDFDVIIGFF